MSLSRDIKENLDTLLEMSNLAPKHTGLSVQIWSENSGVNRGKKDREPRVKLESPDASMAISIEENPRELAVSKDIKQSDKKKFEEAKKYVGRNYDLFLKHYNSSVFEYDFEDLVEDLKSRNEWK